ncbi:hypothetical protein [Streptomyces sp. NRRL F-5053]|uniref:hypothetical protein n=1 Tax=Streptomyces sp. NRRL F-5053 TaxID=1463854 RepID=UPI0004C51257|nr:hypothetical protein [Streptomyces sp. NRRL F-5053]
MYSLSSGYRVPALQRGLSPAEILLTKANATAAGALIASAMLTPPPAWSLGAVGVGAALLNLAPGPRSIGRWAAVGYRHLRERTPPASMTTTAGTTGMWELYPDHGTMQDPARRAAWHAAFARALTFAGNQARTAGIQVHLAHHAVLDDYTDHTQTIAVHIPQGLIAHPERVLDTLEAEFTALGDLAPIDPHPLPTVTERSASWAGLDNGRYAATARITGWPQETDGNLMPQLLLATPNDHNTPAERSLAVLYRPLTTGQSRRSAKWQEAASEAFTLDKVKQEAQGHASDTRRGALVQGATLVDLDAYLTVWGDSPDSVTEHRWQTALAADRHRIQLDWLTGQQHRAHVMTTPHAAPTRKGAVL